MGLRRFSSSSNQTSNHSRSERDLVLVLLCLWAAQNSGRRSLELLAFDEYCRFDTFAFFLRIQSEARFIWRKTAKAPKRQYSSKVNNSNVREGGHDRAGRGLLVIGVCGLRPRAVGLCCHIPWVMKDAFTVLLGESLVTMPSALVREMWDEKWQLSRRGPLYLNLFLEIYF